MKARLWAAALCALAVCRPAFARPFTVEDFLRLESAGAVTVDPTGRWAVLDLQGRYDAAPRFDSDVNMRPAHAHLFRVDLQHPGLAEPAFAQSPRAGYIEGPFSPSGRYMAVYRSLGQRWEIGVLEVVMRRVRWLGFGVDFADKGDTLVWRSDTRLLALRLPPEAGYWKDQVEQAGMQRLPALWRAARGGRRATAVATGSGRWIDVHPSDPVRTVVEIDAASGRSRPLALGVFDGMVLSTSGRKLALIEAAGRVRLSGDQLLTAASQFRLARLRLLDLGTLALATPCAEEPLTTSLRWSPAADALLLYARPAGADWSAGGYRIVGADGRCSPVPTGAVKAGVTLEHASYSTAHGEWIGGAPMLRGAIGDGRPDWFLFGAGAPLNLTARLQASPADLILLTPDRAVFLDGGAAVAVDPQGVARPLGPTGVSRALTPRRPNMSSVMPEDGAPRLKAQFVLGTEGPRTVLWRLTGEHAWRLEDLPTGSQVNMAATASGLMTRTTDRHGVSEIALETPKGGRVVLARLNARLAGVDFPVPIPVEHAGPDVERVTSWLYLPPEGAGARPPLLVMAYPGSVYPTPPVNGRPGEIVPVSDNPLLAVSHGYAVLIPSLPVPKAPGGGGEGWDRQLETAIDAVARTGRVDTGRVGYWGHSYGGYVGLMLATETDRFKAIVAASPMSDLLSVRGQGSPGSWLTPYDEEATQAVAGWTEQGEQGHLKGTPWTARDRFIENSPVFFTDRIHTPLLLVHGDQDIINLAQSREMFSDLSRLGKDALLLTYYGEGHNIVGPANVRVYLETAFGFLDDYLMPRRRDGEGSGRPLGR